MATVNEKQNSTESVKRYGVGLLWILLPKKGRHRLASELDLEELTRLNRSFSGYRKLESGRRRQIELELSRMIRPAGRYLPLALFGVGGLIMTAVLTLHLLYQPGQSALLRLHIFLPLMMGVLAPLSLYFLSGIRQRLIFRPVFSFQIGGFALLTYLGLIWLLFFIGELEALPSVRTDHLTQLALCLGAISAPLMEEVVFRELVPEMMGGSHRLPGHFFAGIFFAVAHLPANGEMLVLYLIAAWLLGLLRLLSEGLFYPLLIHSAANLTHQLLF